MRINIRVNLQYLHFNLIKFFKIGLVEKFLGAFRNNSWTQLQFPIRVILQIMKVIENYVELLSSCFFNSIKFFFVFEEILLRNIPSCQTTTEMLQFVNFFEASCPIIKIHLVTKFSIFNAIITPNNTLVFPPR